MRAVRRSRVWRLTRHEPAWRDALHEAIDDPASARLPRVRALDLAEFLVLWNHVQESVRGDASINLARLLRLHGIDALAVSRIVVHVRVLPILPDYSVTDQPGLYPLTA